MKHSIEWQDDVTNAAPEERATVGDLQLFVDGKNATKHLIDDLVNDHVTVALYGLVQGLTHDWWRIFGQRDEAISLTRYRSGYLLPNVSLQFDGAVFEVRAEQQSYDYPDVRFWGGMTEVMTRTDGEAWLTSLVHDVLNRLSLKGITDTSAHLRWERVVASCKIAAEKAFCEAAGGLGLDPYQISDEAASFIEEAENLFPEREPLIEFVSGSENIDKAKLIEWVRRTKDASDRKFQLAGLREIVAEVDKSTPARHGEQAWALGYRRARAVRIKCRLEQKHRFSTFKDIGRVFGARHSYTLAPKVDGIIALKQEREDGTYIHLRNHGGSSEATSSHLFAMARAVGDAVCFPGTLVAPVNGLQHAFRQSAGRAFAAEFLAPIDEIQSMRHDGHDVYSIANEFAVSPTVIERQLENHIRIVQACA